ncbi:MAG TPA: hypothetical protein VK937_06885 [Candidatus Limnocylindria bacterium]|nr:hypothetical protein [Candidatus Limnocylindria bacterium]
MKVPSLRILLPIAALLCISGSNPAHAQAPLEPAQMSSRTAFYLIWHGVPGPEARKANSLLALWDDADFAPVRSAIASNLIGSPTEKSPKEKLTPEEFQEFAALLENSFTLGYLSEPAKRAVSNGSAAADSKSPAWNGMFFVYDRTGKEVLLAKAILRLRAAGKEVPLLSQVTIGSVQVLRAEGKNGVSYWAEHGKYAVSAGERSVMEEILGRLDGRVSGAASLAQSAAYREAQANLGSGLLEFFLRIPDLENLATDSKAGNFQVRPLLDAARLDAVHSLSGHITFEGAKTHVQAAILGDAALGTPFDIWAAGQPSSASLSFVPADAVSYTSGRLNFPGIYDTVKRVARVAFPQVQQGSADLFDTLAQTRFGMPVADALGLLTGEFASMQTSASMDSTKQVYFLGIRKKPETLKLIRTVFSDQLTSEHNEGDVTFLKISLGGKQSIPGVAQWNFFNLAVTKDMILGANRIESVREVLSNRAHASTAAGLATVPQFQAGRARSPENLNGLSYFDFQRIDWQGLKDRWIEEAKKGPVAKTVSASKNSAPSTAPDWLARIDPQVFARHLHYSSSVSWKDSKGIHWDQWVE